MIEKKIAIQCGMKMILCSVTMGFILSVMSSEGARAATITVENGSHVGCLSGTINQRNASTTIILTGTVKACHEPRRAKYTCTIQVWRIMKGSQFTNNLIKHQRDLSLTTASIFAEIYGLGNPAFCDSQVKEGKTRIFFLNRVDGRLVLAASVLHITLDNLENTQKVVQGISVNETTKKEEDPCLYVLCGYGAKCQSSSKKTAACVCPEIECGVTPGSSDTFAPVCGSDGVTYPSECRVKAAQCWSQRRIHLVSKGPCSPVEEVNPCNRVSCGNSAWCIVEDGMAKCTCRTCGEVPTEPVCGSNQKSYRSECDMKRSACLNALDIKVVRRSACDPCEIYNNERNAFELQCSGSCSLSGNGTSQCCGDIKCAETGEMMICGSDGRTYESRCALERYACKTGKDISEVSEGSCPKPRDTTLVRGSTSIAADDKCPGNCHRSSPEFSAFKKAFEENINMKLKRESHADAGRRSLSSFKIEEVRKGSAVLVYSVVMSWPDEPIDEGFIPGEDSLWAFQRLHDPAHGVLKKTMSAMEVTSVAHKNPADDFMVQEVCGPDQCDYGAGCSVWKDETGSFKYACSCASISVSERMPVTLGCKLANNNKFYNNKAAVKRASCPSETFFTFRDVCKEPKHRPCDELDCARVGSYCVVTNGKASCECISCSEEFNPVCGSDKKTYRNLCLLERENCVQGNKILLASKGMCASQCDEIDCQNGGQCEEVSEGALCTCPSSCLDIYAPVCGSDGKTYQNECSMVVQSCNEKKHITLMKRRPCDVLGGDLEPPTEAGSGEGSGDTGADECGCRFGAVCDATIDDEDARCMCGFTCDGTASIVCGSDGKTYTSECEILKASCEAQTLIQVENEGPCIETCDCNGHGSYSQNCNRTTGQCVCRPGVGGLKCDQCQPGFWNFRAIAEGRSVGCMNCRCHPSGSVRDDCDQMTGHCKCKEGVSDAKCSTCISGSWESPSSCSEEMKFAEATSCDELNCKLGKECALMGEDGLFSCQCPSLSSCNRKLNAKVCASNGITYPNQCQMKVVACREETVVYVKANSSCEAYVASLAPVEPPVKPVWTTTETTTTTTSITASTTPTVLTTVVIPTLPDMPEGSGENENLVGGTIDDEDRDAEGSGDVDLWPSELGPSTQPGDEIGAMKRHEAMIELVVGPDGNDLLFSVDLMSQGTEEYLETSTDMKNRITSILAGKKSEVDRSSIRDVRFAPSGIKGIKMTFSVEIAHDASLSDIQAFINGNLKEGEQFVFLYPDSLPGEALPNVTYVEDGKWTVPQFGGSSYLEFPKMHAYNAATIHMKFRTVDGEGLLLYNGQRDGRDFISLAIIGGYVEFRFDTGSGQLLLRSAIVVDDGKWHNVISRRNRREGMLKVDDEQEISGNSRSGTAGLNLDTGLFIGGFGNSQQDKIFNQVSIRKGLTGCISEVRIGEHGHKLVDTSSGNKNIANSYRVAECAISPCLPSPCRFSGKCFITYQLDEFTYKCDCEARYFGQRCEHLITNQACSSSPCHESSTCTEEGESFRCDCPASRTGKLCDKRVPDGTLPTVMEPSYMPVFAGDSYIKRPTLLGVGTRLEIEIVFFTFQPEGLILYNGQKETGKGDFVALNLREGYLEFLYNLGEGTAIIKSAMPVSLNEWHVAKLSRLGRFGDLKLDDGPIIKGQSPQSHSQLNLGQPLYIGAVDDTVTVAPSAHIATGLMGAIQKFVVNDVTFPRSLMNEDSTSYNVQAFNGHPCYRKPCENAGMCIPDKGGFRCSCIAGFAGEHCEIAEEMDGKSMLHDVIDETVYFDGTTFGQYNNFVTRSDQSFQTNNFEFRMKTRAFHGLIFYDGKPTRQGDFIALALSYGRLHLMFDLGSGPASIISDVTVNDGLWKSVKITRNEHRATLQIDDDFPKQVLAPQLTKWLNTDGLLWLGGCDVKHMPSRHRGVPRSFYMGFEGCLQQLLIDGVLLHIRDDVQNSVAFGTCQER